MYLKYFINYKRSMPCIKQIINNFLISIHLPYHADTLFLTVNTQTMIITIQYT